MTDFATLAASLLANFRTIRIPSSEGLEVPSGDWWAMVKARRLPTGLYMPTASDFARDWSGVAIAASSTVWNPTRRVDGGSTFSSAMMLPFRSWTS